MRPRQVVLLAMCCTCLAPAAGAAPLTLTFDPTGPTASGATAAGEVAWVGVSRVPLNYLQEISTVRKSVTADASGTAPLLLSAPAPQRSLWVAVDVAGGAFTVGTPEDYPLVEEALTPAHLGFDAGGGATTLVLDHRVAEVLVVRPGSGAWSLAATDGNTEDVDGAVNTAVAVSLATLEPLGSALAPTSLQAGDVVVVLDPDRFTYRAAVVTTELLAAGGN